MRWWLLCLAVEIASTGGVSAKPTQLRVLTVPAGELPEGELVLRRADVGQEEIRRLPLRPTLELGLPHASIWEAQARAEGFWAAPLVFAAGEARIHTIRLWRLATVRFPYAVPPHVSVGPSHGSARFRGTTPEAEDLSGELGCSVSADAALCPVPAAAVDLLLRFPGFASEPFWDLHLVPGQVLHLPRRTLRAGASVIGFVCDMKGLPVSAELELRTVDFPRTVDPRFPVVQLRTTSGHRGFFQFSKVPPGTYVLEARTAEGLEASLRPMTVEQNKETEISKPLPLMPPSALEVHVAPPRMPQGQPWKLLLVPLERGRTGVLEKVVPPEGAVSFGRVAPGAYTAILVSSTNDKEVWLQRSVVIPEETSLWLEVPVVRVAGRVREGEAPFSALLAFGGSSGGPQKVVLEANDDGYFEGFLPRTGRWKVAVAGKKKRVVWDGVVDVPVSQGPKPAWIDIIVASTAVSGRVVDSQGNGQGAVTVEVLPELPSGTKYPGARTREDGSFEVRVSPGRFFLQARQGRRASPPRMISVREDEALAGVVLVLSEQNELQGQVVGLPGATAGIQVDAHVLWAGPSPPRGRTDAAGRFQFLLDPGAAIVTVVAFPTSGNLGVACTSGPSGSLQVPVSDVPGGTLEVLEAGRLEAPPQVVARYQGCPLFLFALQEWARFVGANPFQGNHWVYPKLPPGFWELCSYPVGGLMPSVGPCNGGVLPPGGTLQLKLPKP